MVAIKSLLFLATAVTALTIGKRDTATILNDISVINSDVQALTTAANNYNGGVLAAIPILTAQNNLESAIDQGTTDAQATAQQTSAESQSVIAAVDNLIPNSESPPTNSPTSTAGLSRVAKYAISQGKKYDTNNDGTLDKAEWSENKFIEDSFDANGDGKITVEELTKGFGG